MSNGIGDGLRKVLLAGLGAVATTGEKAKELVDELAKKGEITLEQGKVLNEELSRKVKDSLRDGMDVVLGTEPRSVDQIVDDLRTMSKAELENIKAQISAMEQADQEHRDGWQNEEAGEDTDGEPDEGTQG